MTCLFKLLVAAVLGLMGGVALAQGLPPPDIAARSFLLLDLTAQQTLAAKNIDAPVEPASLTKLMTAYLVWDALKARKLELSQRLPVSETAARRPGARMFLSPGMQVPVDDLLKGLVVLSGNDAARVLAEGVGGTVGHFVELMNSQARALGMKNTVYKNPEGLSEPGQSSSARDLGVLAGRLLRDFPEASAYFALKQYRYEASPLSQGASRNLLLFRDPTIDGLAVAYSGTGAYAQVASARREFPNVGARRLLAVVLGAASENARATESQKLLNWGYTAYEAVKLFEADQAVVTPGVWKGQGNQVRLGRPEAIVVAVPAGSAGKLGTEVTRPDPLVAPLQKGQAVGLLKISLAGEPLLELPLLALDGVAQSGLLGRAWDALRLWIQ